MIENRENRQWQRNAAAVFFLALLAWQILIPILRDVSHPPAPPIDFSIYYDAAKRLATGQQLYLLEPDPTWSHFIYSPLLPVLMVPLASLSIERAAGAWGVLNIFFLLAALFFYARAARLSFCDALPLGVMFIVSFKFWPTEFSFFLGQVNFLLLAMICAMYWAQSRKRDVWFGVLIALAALLKVWFLVFIFYLVLRRSWRAVAWTGGAFGLGLAGLFTVVGWNQWPRYLQLSAMYSSQPWNKSDSILGFARKHLAANKIIEPLAQSPALFGVFVAVFFAALLLGMIYLWRQSPARTPYEDRLRLGFFIVSVLLALPLTQLHYFMFCLPLMWTILAPKWESDELAANESAKKNHFTRAASLPAMAGLALIYFAFTRPSLASSAETIPHQGLGTLRMSSYFFMAVLMWSLCWHEIIRARRANESADMSAHTF